VLERAACRRRESARRAWGGCRQRIRLTVTRPPHVGTESPLGSGMSRRLERAYVPSGPPPAPRCQTGRGHGQVPRGLAGTRDGDGTMTDKPHRLYHVVALEVPVVYNFDGDHDHDGMIFALEHNKPELDKLREDFDDSDDGKVPHPLVRPLVLRAREDEVVEVRFTNHIRRRSVGIHLVGAGYDVPTSDGASVGANPSSLAGPPQGSGGNQRTYRWKCDHEGVFPFHDAGNLSGGEDGTNVHGLFGALVVEPKEAVWTDPETGSRLDKPDEHGVTRGDGLYVDVHPRGSQSPKKGVPFASVPAKYPDAKASFREYVVFFHDEPEFMPSHEALERNPCPKQHGDGDHCHACCSGHPQGQCCRHGGAHRAGAEGYEGDGHGGRGGHGESRHEEPLPIMPISYRSEPMINRERRLWGMIRDGKLKRQVTGEEQHHSSWLFGDPATPVLRAYLGDPVRIRLVHAAVKETHVFHQHVYQWHAEPRNNLSPIIDSVSVSPQTGRTIELLYGAGSRQGAIGDAIFHCHLYPHFHEGMWGILRTFDTRHDGSREYPNGAPIARLEPLPDREPPPPATDQLPGFPGFMVGDGAGEPGQKSPVPPWPGRFGTLPPELDYRPATPLEEAQIALNPDPRRGALFLRHPFDAELKVVPRDLAVILTPMSTTTTAGTTRTATCSSSAPMPRPRRGAGSSRSSSAGTTRPWSRRRWKTGCPQRSPARRSTCPSHRATSSACRWPSAGCTCTWSSSIRSSPTARASAGTTSAGPGSARR
jgi:hypothetical protein